MTGLYVLRNMVPVEADFSEWRRFMRSDDRQIDKTILAGDAFVSTVFLGIDPHFGRGRPMLFETMIFGTARAGYCRRYETLGEAKAGHAAVVQLLSEKGGL